MKTKKFKFFSPTQFVSFFGFFLVWCSLIGLDFTTKVLFQKKYLQSFSPTDIKDYSSASDTILHLGSQANNFDFSLTYVRNTGAAWGFLGNMDESIRPYFFYVITAAAILVMFYYFFKAPVSQPLTRMSLCLILAGAFGNFIDRLYLHYVIDWIHVKWNFTWWAYDYPVFNVADSCVTVGVIILLIDAIIQTFTQKKVSNKS